MTEAKLPEPVAHVHSNGDFCGDRQINSASWPVDLITVEQAREYGAACVREERERFAQVARRAVLAMKRAYPYVDEAAEAEYAELDDAWSALQAALGRDGEHCMCPACRGGLLHASDCAVHNEPAMPNGPCDCGAIAGDAGGEP